MTYSIFKYISWMYTYQNIMNTDIWPYDISTVDGLCG